MSRYKTSLHSSLAWPEYFLLLCGDHEKVFPQPKEKNGLAVWDYLHSTITTVAPVLLSIGAAW